MTLSRRVMLIVDEAVPLSPTQWDLLSEAAMRRSRRSCNFCELAEIRRAAEAAGAVVTTRQQPNGFVAVFVHKPDDSLRSWEDVELGTQKSSNQVAVFLRLGDACTC